MNNDVRADEQDPMDPGFVFTGKMLAFRRKEPSPEVKWTRIYQPLPETFAWDKPPLETNVALGIRVGFAYATIKITGKLLVRVPGGGYAMGKKAKVTWHSMDFQYDSWTSTSTSSAWVVTPLQ